MKPFFIINVDRRREYVATSADRREYLPCRYSFVWFLDIGFIVMHGGRDEELIQYFVSI
jgi:hypothetical protein